MTPAKIAPKDFESLFIEAGRRTPGVDLGRYGVTVSMVDGNPQPIPSLPDLEGVFDGGRQFILELKVVTGPSFELRKDKLKPRQVSHMLARARHGVPCFLVIHFNERRLVRSFHPAEAIAIRISDDDPRWRAFVEAYAVAKRSKAPVQPQGSISREEAPGSLPAAHPIPSRPSPATRASSRDGRGLRGGVLRSHRAGAALPARTASAPAAGER